MLIWPYIDIYWIISMSLKQLLPYKIVSQKEFVSMCSRNAEIKYYEGEIDFFECVGIHNINNALKWFLSQRILTTQNVQISKSTFLTQSKGATVSVFQLSETYRNENAIDELSNVINQYRKPIKTNRQTQNNNHNNKIKTNKNNGTNKPTQP
eukprot:209988_1